MSTASSRVGSITSVGEEGAGWVIATSAFIGHMFAKGSTAIRTRMHNSDVSLPFSAGSLAPVSTEPPAPSIARRVAGFVALTKPRIIELLLVTTVPTQVVAYGDFPPIRAVLYTVVGGTLAAGGANAMNMYVDRDIDALMERTKGRPLVTGVVGPREALVFAVAIEILAFLLLWWKVNLLSASLAVGACLFYVFVYTLWLKRTSTSNIVIGGAAGAVPVLIGWTSITGSLAWPPVVLFGVIFLWTPPHFWALAIKYRDDYSAAEVPMLPSVADMGTTARRILTYSWLLWLLTLVFAPVAEMGLLYSISALLLGALFTWQAWGLISDSSPARAMRLFGYSITYIVLLFGAMALDTLMESGPAG